MTEQHPLFLNRDAQSRYLKEKWGIKRAKRTLAKQACLGGGPKLFYVGRIPVSTPEYLDEYAESLLTGPFESTAARHAEPTRKTIPKGRTWRAKSSGRRKHSEQSEARPK